MKASNVIAIDGPSGSGKSTLAKRLASELGILYIDTGSMYRALALKAKEENIPYEANEALKTFLKSLRVQYNGNLSEKLIEINEEDFTEKIRGHEVSELASEFSKLPPVRNFLTKIQRELTTRNTVVMEGRDIGTVVSPNAFCKIYLFASPEVRAERRYSELKKRGENIEYEEVLKDIIARDEKDINREVAPLKVAEDATKLDSSNLTQNGVLEQMKKIVLLAAVDKGISLK